MKKRTCLLYVFNGFSDWEPALAIAGLQQFTDVEVKTFSINKSPVRSMGNVLVQPDLDLDEVRKMTCSILILPGGDPWDQGANREILPLVRELNDERIPLAAICGATSFLAQNQFLDERPHTSNHLEYYLEKEAPSYRGHKLYVKEACVTDGNLITANGTAIVPFAEAIFRKLNVLENEELASWFNFFQHPESILQ